jgi:hypothetical protein
MLSKLVAHSISLLLLVFNHGVQLELHPCHLLL